MASNNNDLDNLDKKDGEKSAEEPETLEPYKTAPETYKKLTTKQKAILAEVKKRPDVSNHAIGKALEKKKLIGKANSAYGIMKYSDLLHAEIEAVRNYNAETMSRTIVPLAIRVQKKALKAKEDILSLKDKAPYVKMALDADMKKHQEPEVKQFIAVDTVIQIQGLIRDNVKSKDDNDIINGEIID